MAYASWPEIFPTVNQPDHEKHLDWTFECGDRDCNWRTYHRSQAAAKAERDRHQINSCPYREVRKAVSEEGGLVPAGKSVIEYYWVELDKVTKFIMDNRAKFKAGELEGDLLEGYNKMQGQAQGLAIAIRIISSPAFRTKNAGPPDWEDVWINGETPNISEVTKHAVKRYRINRGEAEFEPTPGCDGYNPMPPLTREINKPAAKKAAASGPAADPKTGKFKALTDDERTHLVNMHQKGLPAGAIQGMLKISQEQFDYEVSKINAS